MMILRLFAFLFLLLGSTQILQAQQQCPCPYNEEDADKHIPLILHFVMRTDGSGNFNEFDDGLGNTDNNAYEFARRLIHVSNDNLDDLGVNHASPAGTVQPVDANIRFVIAGITFHRSDDLHDFDHQAAELADYTPLREGNDEAIDVFILDSDRNSATSGQAWRNWDLVITTGRSYENYINTGVGFNHVWQGDELTGDDWVIRNAASNLIHEVGHVLNLRHDWDEADGRITQVLCDQTPYPFTCRQGCSNNYMSYNFNDSSWDGSLTGCQLEIMDNDLETTKNHLVMWESDNCDPIFTNATLRVNEDAQNTDFWLYTGSDNYTKYFIEITQVGGDGLNNTVAGTYLGSWYNATSNNYPQQDDVYRISLRSRTWYNFQPDVWYRIKFVAVNDCHLVWRESVNWINSDPNAFTDNSNNAEQLRINLNSSSTRVNVKDQYKIYPNPATSSIFLSSIENIEEISIYSSIGTELKKRLSPTNNQIDVSNIGTGYYILSATLSDGKKINRPFIVK